MQNVVNKIDRKNLSIVRKIIMIMRAAAIARTIMIKVICKRLVHLILTIVSRVFVLPLLILKMTMTMWLKTLLVTVVVIVVITTIRKEIIRVNMVY